MAPTRLRAIAEMHDAALPDRPAIMKGGET